MEALLQAGYVHRDVSEPNIVLVRRSVGDVRHGYLIDWKLASEIREGQPMEAREHCETVGFGHDLLTQYINHKFFRCNRELMHSFPCSR